MNRKWSVLENKRPIMSSDESDGNYLGVLNTAVFLVGTEIDDST